MNYSNENSLLLTEPAVETPGEAADFDRSDFQTSPLLDSPKGHRLVPLLTWLAVVLTIVFVPFKILSHGYLPFDDALRHAAKAISGRDWSDIIVLQDQLKIDHNPGWHWILTQLHHIAGAGADGLVVTSLCTLMLLFMLAPLGWMKRPEAWMAALLIGMVVFPGMLLRYSLARPFLFTVAVTIVVLALWRKSKKPSPVLIAATTILFALAAWIHGSWYLFALVVAAFGLAGHWKSAAWLAGCWLSGSFLGALLTGHPIAFLWNAVNIGRACFAEVPLQGMLVSEFQPHNGAAIIVFLAVTLLIVRALSGNWTWNAVKDPIFILFVIGWLLGFRVVRFFEDWGLPALSLWIAFEMQEYLRRLLPVESFRRLFITGALCLAFFLCVTADYAGRWTRTLTTEYLTETDPEMDPWLPEDGGIIYSSDMQVFYQTFFKNPHAKWRYMLAFEPAFMPLEDQRIYRNIQWNSYSLKAHEPWVAKMRPQDRMVFNLSSSAAPGIPSLEWKYVARGIWIGRLPRAASSRIGVD